MLKIYPPAETARSLLKNIDQTTASDSYLYLPLPTETLREAFGGLYRQELTVLGGYEGHGKSALAGQIAFHTGWNALDTDKAPAVLFCSMEMPKEQVVSRWAVNHLGISPAEMRNPKTMMPESRELLNNFLEELSEKPMYISDSSIVTSSDLNDLLTETREELDISLVVVDYLQLLADAADGEVAAINRTTQNLKNIAKEHRCHIIALSALNRSSGGAPSAGSLRGSGGIGNAADNVVFLHQPYLYDSQIGDLWRNIATLKVTKARSGPVGEHLLRWEPKNLTFQDLNSYQKQQIRVSQKGYTVF